MGKLHELLAVESSLKGMVDKIKAETHTTFNGKNAAYTGFSKTYQPLAADDPDQLPPETKIVGYTVAQKIGYLSEHYIKLVDCQFQKEAGNQKAVGDIVLTVDEDGVEKELTLAKGVPATMLLNLEHKFEELRKLLDEAPTCDPNLQWKTASNELGYISDPVNTVRHKKVIKSFIAAPATAQHPAQVQVYNEDVPIGTWSLTVKSGALTVKEKSALLGRMDILIRAVKKARMRANDIPVDSLKMGKSLFDYIRGELG